MCQSGRLSRGNPPTPAPLGPRCRAGCGPLIATYWFVYRAKVHRGRRFVGFFHRAGSTQPQLGSIAQLENGGVDMLPSYGTGPVTATQTGLTFVMSGTSSELGLLILTYLRRGAALMSVMHSAALKTCTKSFGAILVPGAVHETFPAPSPRAKTCTAKGMPAR